MNGLCVNLHTRLDMSRSKHTTLFHRANALLVKEANKITSSFFSKKLRKKFSSLKRPEQISPRCQKQNFKSDKFAAEWKK